MNTTAIDADLLRRYRYLFDLGGNRTQEIATVGAAITTTDYEYTAANQIYRRRVNAGAWTNFSYDNNGNLTNDGTNTYIWDRANRLLSVGSTAYKYDGYGNRFERSVSGTITKYLLDLQPRLPVVVVETVGANVTRLVHAPRGTHAHKDASNNWEWIVQDGLGSVRGVTSNSAGVLWSGSPAPYGSYFGESGTRQTNYGFTGEYTDPITDMVHLRARDYSPQLGIFPSRDPFEGIVGRPMSLNGYSWVEGNVLNFNDPSGKDLGATLLIASVVLAVAGLAIAAIDQFRRANNQSTLGGEVQNWLKYTCQPAIENAVKNIGQALEDFGEGLSEYGSCGFGSHGVYQCSNPTLEYDTGSVEDTLNKSDVLQNLQARTQSYVRENQRDESENCLGGMSPSVAAQYFALVAQAYWVAGTLIAGSNAPLTIAITRTKRNNVGNCQEFVSVSSTLGSDPSSFQKRKPIYEKAWHGIVGFASLRARIPFANTSIPIIGSPSPIFGQGTEAHAEQLLYREISPIHAMGVSQELCTGCQEFFGDPSIPYFPIAYWMRTGGYDGGYSQLYR